MKRVTPQNYMADSLFPRVRRAVDELVAENLPVALPAVFVKLGMLESRHLKDWREGRVPYLEHVVAGSLGKANRILRMVRLYAHDLKLPVAPPHAAGPIKHRGRPLRFSKTGESRLETAYKCVFNPRPATWKAIAPRWLTPVEEETSRRETVALAGDSPCAPDQSVRSGS
jgi:hypothetical protein